MKVSKYQAVVFVLSTLLSVTNAFATTTDKEQGAQRDQAKIIYIYLFNTLADWEIGHITTGINNPMMQIDPERYQIKTFSTDGKPITTMGGLKITPDITLDDVTLINAAMLILPGGESWNSDGNHEAIELAKRFQQSNIKIAAICGATLGIAKAGLLDSTKHTSNSKDYIGMSQYNGGSHYMESLSINDKGIITAPGTAPLEFAKEVFNALNLYKPEVLEAWYKLFKTSSADAFTSLMETMEN